MSAPSGEIYTDETEAGRRATYDRLVEDAAWLLMQAQPGSVIVPGPESGPHAAQTDSYMALLDQLQRSQGAISPVAETGYPLSAVGGHRTGSADLSREESETAPVPRIDADQERAIRLSQALKLGRFVAIEQRVNKAGVANVFGVEKIGVDENGKDITRLRRISYEAIEEAYLSAAASPADATELLAADADEDTDEPEPKAPLRERLGDRWDDILGWYDKHKDPVKAGGVVALAGGIAAVIALLAANKDSESSSGPEVNACALPGAQYDPSCDDYFARVRATRAETRLHQKVDEQIAAAHGQQSAGSIPESITRKLGDGGLKHEVSAVNVHGSHAKGKLARKITSLILRYNNETWQTSRDDQPGQYYVVPPAAKRLWAELDR